MKKPNIGILFSGYGSQFVGMGKDLYDASRSVQDRFEQASSCLDTNFVKLLFASSDAEISKINNAYLALFLFQTTVVDLLKEKNIIPSLVAGIDVGEFSAVCAAGGITFVDGLYFINKYALAYEQFLVDKNFKQIIVRNCDRKTLEKFCQQVTQDIEFATIAVYQSPNQHAVSGTTLAVEQVEKLLHEVASVSPNTPVAGKKNKLVIQDIGVGSGMHSFVMDEIVKSIKMYLEKIDIKNTTIPFGSGVIGQTLNDGETIAASIMQHIHAPSHVDDIINMFIDCDMIVQIGASKHIELLLEDVVPGKKLYTVTDLKSIHDFVALVKAA